MLIFTGNNEAVSFTDESSPDGRVTGDKICIDGQVDRSLSLDWYYKIIQFFPDVQGELKSAEVARRFKNFPTSTQGAIWTGLRRVKIHIVDPRSHRHRVNNMLRRAWKDDQAPQLLAQQEKQGFPNAKYLLAHMHNLVADSILMDSAAARVQFLGRIFLDPFGLIEKDESLRPFLGGGRRPHQPLISVGDFDSRKSKTLIHAATSWSAKSSVAFHAALDAAMNDDSVVGRYDGDFLRRKMAQQLLPVHAFDDGNQKQLNLLDEKRSELFQELTAPDYGKGLIVKRPGIVPAESRESFYVQAADIAVGIASHIFTAHGLIGVLERFDYVTHNGKRVSRSDAEEEMRRLEVIG